MALREGNDLRRNQITGLIDWEVEQGKKNYIKP
jgi:hypothetical protein